jgi:hypothetical protein
MPLEMFAILQLFCLTIVVPNTPSYRPNDIVCGKDRKWSVITVNYPQVVNPFEVNSTCNKKCVLVAIISNRQFSNVVSKKTLKGGSLAFAPRVPKMNSETLPIKLGKFSSRTPLEVKRRVQ